MGADNLNTAPRPLSGRRPAPTAFSGVSRAGRLLATVAVALLTGSCAVSNLDYFQDNRLAIMAPRTNGTVDLPLVVAWTVHDFDGSFAVFLDRSPMSPGEDLRSLVPSDDRVCRASSACPDANWLSAHGVYVTDQQTLTISSLPDRRTSGHSQDRHELIVVLLDKTGHRIRESAFIREFLVRRES